MAEQQAGLLAHGVCASSTCGGAVAEKVLPHLFAELHPFVLSLGEVERDSRGHVRSACAGSI